MDISRLEAAGGKRYTFALLAFVRSSRKLSLVNPFPELSFFLFSIIFLPLLAGNEPVSWTNNKVTKCND